MSKGQRYTDPADIICDMFRSGAIRVTSRERGQTEVVLGNYELKSLEEYKTGVDRKRII